MGLLDRLADLLIGIGPRLTNAGLLIEPIPRPVWPGPANTADRSTDANGEDFGILPIDKVKVVISNDFPALLDLSEGSGGNRAQGKNTSGMNGKLHGKRSPMRDESHPQETRTGERRFAASQTPPTSPQMGSLMARRMPALSDHRGGSRIAGFFTLRSQLVRQGHDKRKILLVKAIDAATPGLIIATHEASYPIGAFNRGGDRPSGSADGFAVLALAGWKFQWRGCLAMVMRLTSLC
jgi:hypothetical protein